MPGDVLENCRALEGVVAEVGLCFFETEACLDYRPSCIARLGGLRLRYHVHLPLDLDWSRRGGGFAVAVALRARPVRPWAYVLHPPEDAGVFAAFLEQWLEYGLPREALLLENVPELPLAGIRALAYEHDLGLCLDIGHLLLTGEELQDEDLARCRLLHLYAPEATPQGHRHLPLNRLPESGEPALALLRRLLTAAPAARRMLEVFHWPGVAASACWLARFEAEIHNPRD